MDEHRKPHVLFICVHNSARSQMAEELLRLAAGDRFEVESAGLEPTEINPLVVEVMAEVGLDLSRKKTQNVFDLFRQGRLYDYVITVCNESLGGKCPGVTKRWHWPFPNPAAVKGTHQEKLEQVRAIREQIKAKVERPFERLEHMRLKPAQAEAS